MRASVSVDRPLLWVTLLLIVVGFLALSSASAPLSQKNFGHPYYFVLRQALLGLGFGSALWYLGMRIPIAIYKKYSIFLLIGSLVILSFVFIPALGGTTLKGASRWISVGPLSFQPSELLKITLIMYLAAWISARRKEISSFKFGFFPFLVIMGVISLFLLSEPDIGTLGVLAASSLALFFIGGGRASQIAIAVVLGVLLLALLVQFTGYQKERIEVFLDVWRDNNVDIRGSGYQLDQALITIGSGGLFGRGLGLSRQKYQYLPEPAGDAVFAIFAEEFGFFGSVLLLGLFITFIYRGILVAMNARDYYSQLLAGGVTILVAIQVLINIAALTGLIPLTGIPLPFISYGGSALALLLFEVGILMRISKRLP